MYENHDQDGEKSQGKAGLKCPGGKTSLDDRVVESQRLLEGLNRCTAVIVENDELYNVQELARSHEIRDVNFEIQSDYRFRQKIQKESETNEKETSHGEGRSKTCMIDSNDRDSFRLQKIADQGELSNKQSEDESISGGKTDW